VTVKKAAILSFAACALASGAIWLSVRSGEPLDASAPQSPAAQTALKNNTAAPDTSVSEYPPEGPSPGTPLTEAAAAYGAYMEELTLGDRVAQFIENRDRMSAGDRQREADALLSRIAALAAEGRLIKAQSVYLKAAIYDALDPRDDEGARRALLESLEGEPQSERDPYENDARYKELKRREKEIIKEALASSYFPDGMTRQEFLERELSALSREIYGSDANKND
jgi:hypothetical protein